MEAIAKSRNVKGSPQKARLVIDMIRGRNVSQALAILQFTNKRAAKPIAKCLRSAIANATYKAEQQNIAIDPDDLWIKTCFVDMGVHKNRRRLRPAPQGRAYQEQRHYCHITIEVSSDTPDEPVVKLKKHDNQIDPAETARREAEAEKKAKARKKKEKKEKTDQAPATDKKKTAAKDSKSATKADEKAEEQDRADDATEVRTEAPPEQKAADQEKKAEAATEEQPSGEKAKAEEKQEADAKLEEPKQEMADQGVEDSETGEAETPVPATEKKTPADNKPLAAQTDEEETGTDEAADRQVDENEELERQ